MTISAVPLQVKLPDKFIDVPVATPMFGVVKVGEVAKTIAPDPVGVTAAVIAKVPDVVIEAGVTERNEGTVIPTEETDPMLLKNYTWRFRCSN